MYRSPRDTIQSLLDRSFESFSEDTSSPCWTASDILDETTLQGRSGMIDCRGMRKSKLRMSRRPLILEIRTSEGRSGKQVTQGSQMEMFITVGDVRYKLVGALLRNNRDPLHWRSLTPAHGSFLRYDGIKNNSRQINYMRWLREGDNFGKGYSALIYWYASCDHLVQDPSPSEFSPEL